MTGVIATWTVLVLLTGVTVMWCFPFARRSGLDLSPAEIAFLRDGAGRTMRTTLEVLDADGLIEPAPGGGARRKDVPPNPIEDPVERAVYAALSYRLGPRGLLRHRLVRRELAELERRLAAVGLAPGRWRWRASRVALATMPVLAVLTWVADGTHAGAQVGVGVAIPVAAILWFVPRRTIAGQRTLRHLMDRHHRASDRRLVGDDAVRAHARRTLALRVEVSQGGSGSVSSGYTGTEYTPGPDDRLGFGAIGGDGDGGHGGDGGGD
ncbi:TIGR04222 domain-containing membrane protein [Amycolatopsis aidingensis]|uniref:TIGR04222 domain-containing membrane protein n=1 Tax=Amycolatopsis aidingensis TaxID=2842453 RepID=UPI001C0B9FD5|nr:TIGR04222 domain-containing membrane protein [Amycolatopsis aidingensis]